MKLELPHVALTLDALHCGAAIIDRSGRLVHVNPRLAALYGATVEQLLGRDLHDVFDDPEFRQHLDDALARFDQPREGESHIPLPGGVRLPVLVAARPLGDAPPLDQYRVVTVMDLRSQRESYRQLAELSNVVLSQALDLKDNNKLLEIRVAQRTAELHQANMDAIYMLAVACEHKDEATGHHVRRIQRLAELTAEALGLAAADCRVIGYSAILHDVGKIHVPDQVLKKPGPLDAPERAVMEQHTLAGESILSDRSFFTVARQIARAHHENWDGSGYPDRRAGEAIPLAARIVRVVDVFDALSHRRIYKPAWPHERVRDHLQSGGGRLFDPAVLRAFETLDERGVVRQVVAESGGDSN
jgi:putative nucleotidyltransferase with HDIG domain/PAS domain S-box-containing protein